MKLMRNSFYENLVNSRTTQACTLFLTMHLILPFKSAVTFLNVLVLCGIFGRDIRCDVNKRFTPRWQEVCGKYQSSNYMIGLIAPYTFFPQKCQLLLQAFDIQSIRRLCHLTYKINDMVLFFLLSLPCLLK